MWWKNIGLGLSSLQFYWLTGLLEHGEHLSIWNSTDHLGWGMWRCTSLPFRVLDKWKALANVKESSLRLGYFHDAQAGSEIGVLFIALYQLPKGWVESIPSRFPKWWSIIYIYIYWLVVLTILKNMKVSWDDYPIYDGNIKFMFQT